MVLGAAVPEPDPRVSMELSDRAVRIDLVLAGLRGENSTTPRRGILLNEWNQADSALMYELTSLVER